MRVELHVITSITAPTACEQIDQALHYLMTRGFNLLGNA
jgi:hypothetical protein